MGGGVVPALSAQRDLSASHLGPGARLCLCRAGPGRLTRLGWGWGSVPLQGAAAAPPGGSLRAGLARVTSNETVVLAARRALVGAGGSVLEP